MSIPNNILQQVQTYADAGVEVLSNLNCFIAETDRELKDFQNKPCNLGDTINIEIPVRATISNGLIANFTGVNQPLQPLVCDQAANSANAFTSQQFIFNAEEYLDKFGLSRVRELAANIEANVALNAISAVPVMTVNSQGESVPTGALHTESGPFRFYGDGFTPINSFGQLAKMEAFFRNYGAVDGPLKVFFDDINVTDVINSGLNQFVPARNEAIANSWDLGTYKGSSASYFKSNLLPIQYAGTVGNNQDTLTLSGTNDPTGANITQLTFTGVTSNAGAFKSGDLIQFDAANKLYYLTYIGHKVSRNLVQLRVTADADATTGTVTVNITPPLVSQSGINQNLSKALVNGMTVHALPDHRAGLITSGRSFFLAMPALDDQYPFPTGISTDKDTGISLRNYYGVAFGQNQKGYVNDCIWASTVIEHMSMRVIFPAS